MKSKYIILKYKNYIRLRICVEEMNIEFQNSIAISSGDFLVWNSIVDDISSNIRFLISFLHIIWFKCWKSTILNLNKNINVLSFNSVIKNAFLLVWHCAFFLNAPWVSAPTGGTYKMNYRNTGLIHIYILIC